MKIFDYVNNKLDESPTFNSIKNIFPSVELFGVLLVAFWTLILCGLIAFLYYSLKFLYSIYICLPIILIKLAAGL